MRPLRPARLVPGTTPDHQLGGPVTTRGLVRRGSFGADRAAICRPAPRSVALWSRRPAGKRVQRRTPSPDALSPWPNRPRDAHPTTQTPNDRAHSRATAPRPLSCGERRNLRRQRTNLAAVSSECLPRRERRRAKQRSNEHHCEQAAAGEHHASHQSKLITACDHSLAPSVPRHLSGCWDLPESPPSRNHDSPNRRSTAAPESPRA